MDSSDELKEAVERAKTEIEALLREVDVRNLAGSALATGLKRLEKEVHVLDIHIGHHRPDP